MISTTAQVNTFGSGMNLDYDVSIVPEGEYIYAENVRIMTNDSGTSGVLLSIEGAAQYKWENAISKDEEIIGTATIHKYGIIITAEGSGESTINRVYRILGFDTNTLTHTVVLKGRLGLCTDRKTTPNVSIVSNYESDGVVKIYFTDGNSAIKQLNIVDDKYVDNTLGLLDEEGNILNTKALDITPGAVLTPFKIAGLGMGNLPVGVVQYCYQLFNLRSSETTVSPMSPLVHLTSSTTNQNSQDYMGDYPGNSSGKSCTVEAELITKDFDKCRILSIRYTENNSIPTIVVVDEIDIAKNQTKITYTDTGNAFLGEITVDEFNNLVGYQFFAKTITKLLNRLFAANVTEDTWKPEWDARAYRANTSDVFKIENGDGTEITGSLSELNKIEIDPEHDCINPYNNLRYHDTNDSTRYDRDASGRLGGTGLNVSYHFVTAPIKLTDESGLRSSIDPFMNASSVAMGSVKLSAPGDTGFTLTHSFSDGNRVRIPNYADPTIAAELTGYNRDEVYRFGIILYNDKSLPSPVFWIGDIRFPHAQQCPPFVRKQNASGDYVFEGLALGIVFYVNNLPAGTTAYEIVRCDRTELDRSVLMQGALSNLYTYNIQELDKKVGEGDRIDNSVELRSFTMPTFAFGDLITHKRDATAKVYMGNRDGYYFKMFSPEICVQQELIERYLNSSCNLDYLYFTISHVDTSENDNYVDSYGSLYNDEDSMHFGKSRTFSAPSYVLQSTGTEMSLDAYSNWTSFYQLPVESHASVSFQLPWGLVTGTGYEAETQYAGSIAKYYDFVLPDDDYYNFSNLIEDAKYPPIIQYNSYTSGVLPYRINIGEKMFTNWNMSDFEYSNKQVITGPGGPCLVIKTSYISGLTSSSVLSRLDGTSYVGNAVDYVNALPIYNVKRNVTPYGGITYTSRQNSVYLSTGAYKNITEDIDYKTCVTYGGDTYLNLLDYLFTATFQANDEATDTEKKHYVGCYIPFESSINMNLFNGDMAHRSYRGNLWNGNLGNPQANASYLDTHLQTDVTQKGTYHVQDRPYYLYNPVYSVLNGNRQYVPSSIYSIDDLHSSNRIYVSEPKINNEALDAWTAFKVANYLDVDSQWGDITNLVNFNNKLLFFQDTALGVAAVNERVLIDDGLIGQLTLGTGGVLERFDYLTTGNGSSIVNDRSIVTTASTLYWYDVDKNEICAFDNQLNTLSKNKFVQSYLNGLALDQRNVTLSMYDRKFNEVWFKFYNKSLIFNELVGRFTAFYTFNPQWSLVFSNVTVGIKGNKLYRLNTLEQDADAVRYDKDSKLKFVVNADGLFTKTFDNVRLQGNFVDGVTQSTLEANVIDQVRFDTKHLTTGYINNIPVDYREDSYRFAIPRQENNNDPLSYPARMRGKYLICEYKFITNDESTFEIPSITTTYRYSLI